MKITAVPKRQRITPAMEAPMAKSRQVLRAEARLQAKRDASAAAAMLRRTRRAQRAKKRRERIETERAHQKEQAGA